MRAAVVGHVEWCQFARVGDVPAPGAIVTATEAWEEAAGGGGVSAVQLVKLGADTTLFTALSRDRLGTLARRQLEGQGVSVASLEREAPQRRGFVHVDASGERTITVLGAKESPSGGEPLPWAELDSTDCAYFVSGDPSTARAARRARVLVATARVLPTLRESGVELDVLVRSANDPGEAYAPGDLDPPPRYVVATAGSRGGGWTGADGVTGEWAAAEVPGAISDSYGCGDSFAAGLTFGLGAGMSIGEALELGARCGAANFTGRGGYEGQLRLT